MGTGGLGSELRRLRTAADMTQEELAESAGLSVRAVSDTERGLRTRLYPGTTTRLADALGVTGAARERFVASAHGSPPRAPLTPLPDTRHGLVRREAELRELVALLNDPSTRIVTLAGPGGVGKTRLALAAAGEAAPSFADGVAFVQLAASADAHAAGLAIATAIGANPAHGTISDIVCKAIGERRLLILCDTFEGALGAAGILGDAIRRCPGATFLATSRAPLRLADEHLVRVEPLPADAAAQLFRERAMQARPGADLSGSDAVVEQICERVQGLPLAVELAAARVAHLGLTDLRDRLGAQLAILTGGPVDDDARHRTLEATVAWSYGLIDAGGQRALARLAVFDGWSLPAAAAVLGGDPLPSVTALVDQSLAFPPDPTATPSRYRMLDAVREFGLARLAEAADGDAARDLHAAWFLAAAEAAAGAIRQTGQRAAHRELAADLGNLRLAFRRYAETGRGSEALRLAAALWMFWMWQGGFSEGRAWLREALHTAEHDAEPSSAARARHGAFWLAYLQGDWAEARLHASALTALANASQDHLELRNALTLRGMLAMADRRLADAADLLGQALTTARSIEPATEWLLAISILNDGVGLTHVGRLDEAARRFAEARDSFEDIGDQTYLARALRHLAAVGILTGDVGAAEALLGRSLEIESDAGDQPGLAETFSGMAHLAAVTGEVRRAGALEARAAVVRRSLGVAQHPFDAILAERYLGPLRGTPEFEEGAAEASGGAV